MFILIAPVNWGFNSPEDFFRRREDIIRKFYEDRVHNTPSINSKPNEIELSLDRITPGFQNIREALINNAIIAMYENRREINDINNEDFQELFVEQDGNTLHVRIFNHSYPPLAQPGKYDAMEKLNQEFDILNKAISNGDIDINNVIVYFDRVKYLNSEGLGKLIILQKVLKALDGRLELTGVNPQLNEVLRITHLDSYFNVIKMPEDKYKEIIIEQFNAKGLSDKNNALIKLRSRSYLGERAKILKDELEFIMNTCSDAGFVVIDFDGVEEADPSLLTTIYDFQQDLSLSGNALLIHNLSDKLRKSKFGLNLLSFGERLTAVTII